MLGRGDDAAGGGDGQAVVDLHPAPLAADGDRAGEDVLARGLRVPVKVEDALAADGAALGQGDAAAADGEGGTLDIQILLRAQGEGALTVLQRRGDGLLRLLAGLGVIGPCRL